MHGLLHDVVAGKPRVVLPITNVILHVAPLGVARRFSPETTGVVRRIGGTHLSDPPVVDALENIPLPRGIPPAEAGYERELFFYRHCGALSHAPQSCRIDCHRLLTEDMLSSLDGRLQVQRPKRRRRGQQHNIAARDQILVAVQTRKLAFGWAIKPISKRRVLLGFVRNRSAQHAGSALQPIGKRIGQCPEHHPWIGMHRLHGGTAPTAATPHETHFESIAPGGVSHSAH